MSLRLTWKNNNVVMNVINIYRGDAPLDPNNLPAPLAVVSNGDQFYVDETAVFGNTYYYIFGTKTDNDLILTGNQKILVADNRGAGPSTLLLGNDTVGFYGEVLSSDFFTSADIIAALKRTTGIPGNLIQPAWAKMTRNGKIIYVPNSCFGQSTWGDLYHAGLVFGMDSNGPADASLTGVTPTNQKVELSLNGNKYLVRLLRGWGDGPYANLPNYSGTMEANPNFENNEFSDLIYALQMYTPPRKRTVNFLNYSIEKWIDVPGANWSNSATVNNIINASRIVVQERTSNNNAFNRAARYVIYGPTPPAPGSSGYEHLDSIWYQAINASVQWLPVIELVETSVAVTL